MSTWSEMPVDAASEMIATSFSPAMNADFSATLMASISADLSADLVRSSYDQPPRGERTSRAFRPVISATCSGPPRPSISASSAAAGRSSAETSESSRSRACTH